ncbi:hypothetical protein FHD68_15685 [Paracoccus marcusii]|nr:hypothetical protein FHD68_15685 [Paracoccus marcusii]
MPSSPCFRTNAFCASVNLDAFIVLRSSPSQGRLTENSSFKRSSFQGAEHPNRCIAGFRPVSRLNIVSRSRKNILGLRRDC